MPMDDQLPQELVDNIIDHLHADKYSLDSLSTVSKSWLPSCRLHLFNSICIKRKWSEPVDDFADFVESTPDIWTYIKSLQLKGQFKTSVLVRILACLSQLRSLKLQGEFLQVEPTVIPFSPLRLDLLLVELIYSKNYPERTVYVTEARSESGDDGEDGEDGNEDGVEDEMEDGVEDNEGGKNARSSDDGNGSAEEPISEDHDSVEDEDGIAGDNGDEADGRAQETAGQTDAYDSNHDEVERLISVLRLFCEVRELVVAYASEHPSWKLTAQKLLALVPKPTMLKVETFRFYHEEPDDSVFSFFSRYLHIPSIQTLMVKTEFYPEGEIFRTLLLGAPSLTDLNICANGFAYDCAHTFGLPLCVPLRSLTLKSQFTYSSPDTEPNSYDPDSYWIGNLDWAHIKAIIGTHISQIHYLSIVLAETPMSPRHLIQGLEDVEWPWLEDCLLGHYPNLKTLTFRYKYKKQGRATPEDVVKYVREQLPRMHTEGKVRFAKPLVPLQQIPPWYDGTDSDRSDSE